MKRALRHRQHAGGGDRAPRGSRSPAVPWAAAQSSPPRRLPASPPASPRRRARKRPSSDPRRPRRSPAGRVQKRADGLQHPLHARQVLLEVQTSPLALGQEVGNGLGHYESVRPATAGRPQPGRRPTGIASASVRRAHPGRGPFTPPTCPPTGLSLPPRPHHAGRSIAVRACVQVAVRAARIQGPLRSGGAAARRHRGRRARRRA